MQHPVAVHNAPTRALHYTPGLCPMTRSWRVLPMPCHSPWLRATPTTQPHATPHQCPAPHPGITAHATWPQLAGAPQAMTCSPSPSFPAPTCHMPCPHVPCPPVPHRGAAPHTTWALPAGIPCAMDTPHTMPCGQAPCPPMCYMPHTTPWGCHEATAGGHSPHPSAVAASCTIPHSHTLLPPTQPCTRLPPPPRRALHHNLQPRPALWPLPAPHHASTCHHPSCRVVGTGDGAGHNPEWDGGHATPSCHS